FVTTGSVACGRRGRGPEGVGHRRARPAEGGRICGLFPRLFRCQRASNPRDCRRRHRGVGFRRNTACPRGRIRTVRLGASRLFRLYRPHLCAGNASLLWPRTTVGQRRERKDPERRIIRQPTAHGWCLPWNRSNLTTFLDALLTVIFAASCTACET